MITEDYVSFETAKLLKEKGFNAQCNYVWMLDKANNPKDTDGVYKISSSHFMEGESYVSNEDIDKVLEYSDEYYNKDAFLCPTLQMAMKWLRKVHNINPDIVSVWNQKRFEYQVFIVTPENAKHCYVDDKLYLDHEEAEEAGIKYCLENLI